MENTSRKHGTIRDVLKVPNASMLLIFLLRENIYGLVYYQLVAIILCRECCDRCDRCDAKILFLGKQPSSHSEQTYDFL